MTRKYKKRTNAKPRPTAGRKPGIPSVNVSTKISVETKLKLDAEAKSRGISPHRLRVEKLEK